MPDISLDYVIEDDLRGFDLDQNNLIYVCLLTTESSALNGTRCWAADDLAALFAEVPA